MLFWSGPRESDIDYTGDLFAGSATFYGSNIGSNSSFCGSNATRINHNIFHQDASDFILNWQLDTIAEHPDCKFMSYNPNNVYGAPEAVVSRTICLNDEQLMEMLNNKIKFRDLISGKFPSIPANIFKGSECLYTHLSGLLGDNKSFVIQEPVSSGGQGTYLMNEINSEEVFSLLDRDKLYIVTEYIDHNIPVNVHAVIFDSKILILPGSVQIIGHNDDRLLYRGADFCTFGDINEQIRYKLYSLAEQLSELLQKMGYRGIVGYDALIADGEVYLSEINNRFQGSSLLVTKALVDAGFPSLHELNMMAFNGAIPDNTLVEHLRALRIPYSMYNYIYEDNGVHPRFIYERAQKESRVLSVVNEGYNLHQTAEPYASLFSLVFNFNITSLYENDSIIRIHPNIVSPLREWSEKILSGDLTALKVSLINRGVVLTDRAKNYIHKHGDMRGGTYFALDLFIHGLYINAPLYTKLTFLSPFTIDVEPSGGLALRYYETLIGMVDYDKKERLLSEKTASHVQIDKILFFASDRVRIQNSSCCTFAKNGVVCRFCEADGMDNHFTEQDIIDSIDILFNSQNSPMFRHVLIGGLSNDIGSERETLIRIIRKIRSYSDKPIYLMCLPPKKIDIAEYFAEGVTEFGFNIEIYDRSIAKRIMPGKGRIPLNRYMDSLKEAVRLCGSDGAVRTAFIVGLEPKESLMQGIEDVCKIGVAPILSAFRPIPFTQMADVIPPTDEYLYEITVEAERISNKYGLSLGPTCPACRNNTLTIANKDEVTAIFSAQWRRDAK